MNGPKIEKPEKPAPNECCGGGSCCPCVWDRYYEQLRQWQEQEGLTPTAAPPMPSDEEDFFR